MPVKSCFNFVKGSALYKRERRGDFQKNRPVTHLVRAITALLPSENNNILGLKCSLRHEKQILKLFIAPFPLYVLNTRVCAIGNPNPGPADLLFLSVSNFHLSTININIVNYLRDFNPDSVKMINYRIDNVKAEHPIGMTGTDRCLLSTGVERENVQPIRAYGLHCGHCARPERTSHLQLELHLQQG